MATTANTQPLIRIGYGLYSLAAFMATALAVAAALLVVPGVRRRRSIARFGAALAFRLMLSPVTVRGDVESLPPGAVVVANHASYLDGIILTAVLPAQYTFLIKREMNAVPLAGFVLRRLGSEFVDRSSKSHRRRSARRLIEAAAGGSSIAVFPEGTFDEQRGLKPFHIGAFRAAIRSRLPVVPVVIRGSRQKLPAGAFLPAPGPLTVTVCEPIPPGAAADSDQLQRLTRRRILEWLGEPDLDPPVSEAVLQ